MALSRRKTERVKQEMERLSERIREFEEAHGKWAYYAGSPESAAVKRASMDLTRALVDLRKP